MSRKVRNGTFQMIPIAGLVFGAFINRSAVKDIAEAGKMLYRKRRIIKSLKNDVRAQNHNSLFFIKIKRLSRFNLVLQRNR